jgi:GTPase SAR1 family protein
MMKNKQPAELSYFFHGGFVDMGNVIAGAFKYCGENISDSAEKAGEAWSDFSFPNICDLEIAEIFTNLPVICKVGFHLARLVFSATVTPLFCIFITIFQVSLLVALFSAAAVLFVIVFLLDKIYCMINAIVSHCPICQSKFTLPIYICPKCGAKHDRLYPGVYGILKRTCQCGHELPTIFFNGRHKLEAQCPHCRCNIKDGGLHASWFVPVVGGPSSGKTCYINMAMMSLEKNAYSRYGLRFEHEKNGQDEYEENARNLSNGYLPPKTNELRLKYYQFTLTYKNTTKQQISLCDVAGELFDVNSGGNEINKQTGFRYVNTFMLVIDPLSIPEYRNEVSKTIDLSGYNSGSQRIDEMLDTFVRTLQNMFSINPKAMLKTDVAVVFTKADIPGLDQKIGESAVLKNAKGTDQKSRYETQNNLCEQFLRDYSEDNFLNSLKSRFKSRQFFTCSALGHIVNGQPFISSNVDEPLLWLVRKRSNVINDVIKKGGK